MAFAGEAHTSQTAGSESGVRRSRKAVGKPAAKVTKSRAEAESDQNLHSRSAMSQAIIASSDPPQGPAFATVLSFLSQMILLLCPAAVPVVVYCN